MHPTRNDLPSKTRKKVIAILSARLADASDLTSQAKQAHWNVKGPQFAQLHTLFDAVYANVSVQVDDLAEVQLTEEMPEFWVFFARSEKLIQASHAPGGMHVTVDKQSGHIWTRTEIQSYYEARAASSRQKIAA